MNYDSVGRLAHISKLDYATTFLYVYNEALAKWEIIPLLQDPVAVNYSIDDSSDNASISFISTTLTSKLQNGTLVTLVYAPNGGVASDWGIPAYSGYKPTNHDVYTIKQGKCVLNGNSLYCKHTYTLVELIELTKEISMETLTFTSDTQVTVKYASTGVEATYYKAPYNAYTILQRILTQTRTPTIEDNNCWLNKIIIADYDYLLGQLVGVDDTFSENTLYDALIKLGGYLGRIPVMYMNKDYTGSNQQFVLYFEKREYGKTSPVTLASLKALAIEYSEDDDSPLAKSIVANAKNMIGSKLIYYPSKNQYAPANNKDLEATSLEQTSELCIVLDYPISQVKSITQLKYVKTVIIDYDTDLPIGDPTYATYYLDIPCFKYQDWLVQDDRTSKAYFKENDNIIIFGNEIKNTNQGIGGSTYVIVTTYYYYNVEAYTNISANAIIGDGEYTQFFNQTDSLVDSSTFGEQLTNYKNANSGADYVLSLIVDNYVGILQCGQYITNNSDKYYINGVSFNTFKSNGVTKYKVVYKINKDYIRRNSYIQANSGVRNYQTYYENTQERLINIKEQVNIKIILGDQPDDLALNGFNYIQNKDVIFGGMLSNDIYGQEVLPMPETAVLKCEIRTYTSADLSTSTLMYKYVQLNVNKTMLGNSVILNMRALDNVSVGNHIGEPNSGGISTQMPTIYTNPFGNIDLIQLALAQPDEISNLANNFPVVDSSLYSSLFTASMVRSAQIYVNKDSREILNITLQFEFVAEDGTEISTDLIQYSGLLGTREFIIDKIYDEGVYFPQLQDVILAVASATVGTYDVGDIMVSPSVTLTDFIEKTGYNIRFNLRSAITKGTYDYFIVNKVGDNYKIIAKIDVSGVTNGTSISYVTICY